MDAFANINTLWATVFVDELARLGVRDVVITPGSRSTPLVLAFAAHPDIRDHSMIDERAAGFFAIGIAQATRRPAALVCTSGTAAANYLPAVCEADLNSIPLLVLTADRPEVLRDTGASQAMDQVKLFADKVRWFHEVALPEADATKFRYLRTLAGRAVGASLDVPGPVHLDFPFRKPLEPTRLDHEHRDSTRALELDDPGVAGRPAGAPLAPLSRAERRPGAETLDRLATAIEAAERPLVIAGYLADGAGAREGLVELTTRAKIPVWAEAGSQLRFFSARPKAWIAPDTLLSDANFARLLEPDLVVMIGKPPINWPLQAWVRDMPEWIELVRVVPNGHPRASIDPEHRGGDVVEADLPLLFRELASRVEAVEERDWHAWHERAADALEQESSRDELFDGAVFAWLAKSLPEDAALVVSSSMPLRNLEVFAERSPRAFDVFANRGLNGIDGVISTGLGVAMSRKDTFIVVGDVAFAHDVGSLVAARLNAIDATIIVVNNGGGAIFEYLPVAKGERGVFERHFTTDPGIDIESIAAAYGAKYTHVELASELDSVLAEEHEGLRIVEVKTDAARSRELHREFLQRSLRLAAPPLGPGTSRTRIHEEPVVLLHGFTGDHSTWNEIAPLLGESALALDLIGHGRGRIPASRAAYSMDAYVEDVILQLDARGIDRCRLVGYSMGGRIALALALKHPERFTALATIGANAGLAAGKEREERQRSDELLADRIEAHGLHTFVDAWMTQDIFRRTFERRGPEWVRRSRDQRLGGTSRGYAMSLRGCGQGAQPVYWDELKGLAMPALFLAGEDDPKYRSISKRMAARAPKGRAEVVSAAGHAAHVDAPERVAELIRNFFEETQ